MILTNINDGIFTFININDVGGWVASVTGGSLKALLVAAVMGDAETLQIIPVQPQSVVALVRDDVVDMGNWRYPSGLETLNAQRIQLNESAAQFVPLMVEAALARAEVTPCRLDPRRLRAGVTALSRWTSCHHHLKTQTDSLTQTQQNPPLLKCAGLM